MPLFTISSQGLIKFKVLYECGCCLQGSTIYFLLDLQPSKIAPDVKAKDNRTKAMQVHCVSLSFHCTETQTQLFLIKRSLTEVSIFVLKVLSQYCTFCFPRSVIYRVAPHLKTRPGDLVGAGPNWVTFWSKFVLFQTIQEPG